MKETVLFVLCFIALGVGVSLLHLGMDTMLGSQLDSDVKYVESKGLR